MLAGLSLACLAAACSPAPTPELTPPPSDAAAAADVEESFADRLASIHMLLIEAGAIMKTRASTHEARTFAMALADEVEREDAALIDAAARAKAPFATAAPASDKLLLVQNLETMDQAGVDLAYLHLAVAALTDEANLLASYAKDGQDQALRAYAESAAPRARTRLDSAIAARDVATAEAPPP